jgi:protein O-mannosyl-transferase
MSTLSTIKKVTLIALGLVLVIIAYANHFHNPFEFDDAHTIETNTAIRDIKNIPRFFKDATTTSSLPKSQAYRPGLTTLNAIDYYIGGKALPDPFYYHLSIFLSFLGLLICLFFFFQQLLISYANVTQRFLWALVGATLFGVHMANSQTINYIIARADSFSTCMVVIAFLMYLYSKVAQRYYLYLLPVFIGFLVKEPAIMFVPLLMVYQLLFEKREGKEITTEHPFALKQIGQVLLKNIFPLLFSAGMYAFSRYMTPKVWSSGNQEVLPYLLSQPYVILHYFNNFLFPFNFVVDTDWEFVTRFTEDRVIIGFIFIALLVYCIFKSAQHHAPMAFGLSWFLLSLLPTSSIFPLAEVLNDHRPFFGYIGLTISSIYGLFYILKTYQLKRLKELIAISVCLIIIGHVLGTRYHNQLWSKGESLWQEATIQAPKNGRVWMNYGNTLMARGAYPEAETAFLQAIKLWPDFSYTSINLGILYNAMGKDTLAESYFMKAKNLDAGNPEVYVYFAKFLKAQKRETEASAIIAEGLQNSPTHADLLLLKQEVDLILNNPQQYQNSILQAAIDRVQQNPTPENYLELSLTYYNAKQFEDCIKACEQALSIKPNYALAYNNICSAYNQLKQWEKAEIACKKGLAIEADNALLKGNLSIAINAKEKK